MKKSYDVEKIVLLKDDEEAKIIKEVYIYNTASIDIQFPCSVKTKSAGGDLNLI